MSLFILPWKCKGYPHLPDHAAVATSLTEHLVVISDWAKKWAVQFNSQNQNYRYFGLHGDEIDEIDNHCHLGIYFNQQLHGKNI